MSLQVSLSTSTYTERYCINEMVQKLQFSPLHIRFFCKSGSYSDFFPHRGFTFPRATLILQSWGRVTQANYRPSLIIPHKLPPGTSMGTLHLFLTKGSSKVMRYQFLRNYVFFLRKRCFPSQKTITPFSEIYDFFLRKSTMEQRIDSNLCKDQLSCHIHDNYLLWGFFSLQLV